jgi:hypothetical protein
MSPSLNEQITNAKKRERDDEGKAHSVFADCRRVVIKMLPFAFKNDLSVFFFTNY